ncbi:nitrogenase molybdenum-iron protein beta chain [Clostridium acidisoli DSM 12555]|uniref:Nitrogenase molybdenum-iron protein beta chain n=1 Tax=Clostridium acidisoli DSM 12555 TaxID=1121291 RepID=A0A1W1XUH2_9CLOT|nr:nitrogenase component 1 [Clostridium acidisoli]SMC27630.1 nitrogenase molybdenum-iron protein beta chain [Clostridium acidisoli DSM 12555]
MSKCIENPRTSCALGGALAVATGVERVIPIFHAGPGCGLQVSIGQKTGYIGGIGCPSTNMFEKEVVFGGIQRLRETIEGSLEVMDGDLYVVLTGCTSGIIGDDVDSVVNEFKRKGVPILNVQTSGFKGDTYYGYEITLDALVNALTETSPKKEKTINLFGIVPHQDIFWQGNFEELTRILNKLGIKVNTFFTEHQGIETIKKSSEAALNVVLSPWLLKDLAETYQNKFDVDTYRYPGLPIGPTATSKFIRELSEKLNLDRNDVEKVIEEEEDYVYSHFERNIGVVSNYRFIIVGDANTVIGVTKFLANDYSQVPLLAVITDDIPKVYHAKIEEVANLEYGRKPKVVFETDKWKISELIREFEDEATLLMGSSFEKEIGNELDIFTTLVSYPNTETFIINKGYAGYRGCLTFLEDLYNNN